MEVNTNEIEKEINEKFGEGIRAWMKSEGEKRDKNYFHVSSFVYECVRRVWYEKKYMDLLPELDIQSIYRMWIGTKLHETPVSSEHEVPVYGTFDGVEFGGRIDEIITLDNKMRIIVDKKFTNKLPYTPHEHYLHQIMFYAALLHNMTGEFVSGVALHYLTPTVEYGNSEREKSFVRMVTPEEILQVEEVIKEMTAELKRTLAEDTLPTMHKSWYCTYCPFKVSCDAGSKEYMAKPK